MQMLLYQNRTTKVKKEKYRQSAGRTLSNTYQTTTYNRHQRTGSFRKMTPRVDSRTTTAAEIIIYLRICCKFFDLEKR
jgi:hypothetical protein